VVRLAPFPTDDGFRVLRPAPIRIDGLSTYDEPAYLDHFLDETGEPNHLVWIVKVLGGQVHVRIMGCCSAVGQDGLDPDSGHPKTETP
jgi:hypothetical protein